MHLCSARHRFWKCNKTLTFCSLLAGWRIPRACHTKRRFNVRKSVRSPCPKQQYLLLHGEEENFFPNEDPKPLVISDPLGATNQKCYFEQHWVPRPPVECSWMQCDPKLEAFWAASAGSCEKHSPLRHDLMVFGCFLAGDWDFERYLLLIWTLILHILLASLTCDSDACLAPSLSCKHNLQKSTETWLNRHDLNT